MKNFAASKRSALLSALFARYIKGEIEEPLWKRFLSMLDAIETQPQERMALIAFMNDFLIERSVQALQLSKAFADEFVPKRVFCAG